MSKRSKLYAVNLLKHNQRNYIDLLELRNLFLELAITNTKMDPTQSAVVISILDSINATFNTQTTENEVTLVEIYSQKLIKLIQKIIKANQKQKPINLTLEDDEDDAAAENVTLPGEESPTIAVEEIKSTQSEETTPAEPEQALPGTEPPKALAKKKTTKKLKEVQNNEQSNT